MINVIISAAVVAWDFSESFSIWGLLGIWGFCPIILGFFALAEKVKFDVQY